MMDNAALKQREHDTWAAVAEGWRRRDALLRKGAAPVTERMLELAGIAAGHRVLDIASGTGEPAISAAHRAGPQGQVIGTDLVEEMLAVARDKVAATQLENIEFHCIDGEMVELEAASFDAVTIRWGLMFMPDPGACLAHAMHMLKQDGKIVAACWAEPERNPFVSVLMQTLARYTEIPRPPPGSPGIFAFADPERLVGVVEHAGFVDVQIEDMELDVVEVGSGAEYWATMEDLAGPVTRLVNQLDAATRQAYVDDVIATAEAMKSGERLAARGTTWIVSATRP